MNNIAEDLNTAYSNGFVDGYKQGLKDATKWTPMSEREPEYGNYIVTYRKKNDPEDERLVTTDYYASYGWDDDGDVYETLAWMPKPDPYKGE